MKKSPEILERVKELHKQWLSSKRIAQIIEEELWETISDRTIRLWLKNNIDNELKKLDDLRKKIEYTNPFEFEWDDIVFYTKSRDWEWYDRIAIPIDIVEKIWVDYVEVWWNLTWQEILEKYNLNPRAWHLLKSRLWLYKKSNIMPDWLLEKIENEEWEESVENVINEVSYKAAVSKYKREIVKRYNRAKESEYKKAITRIYEIEEFLKWLREYIDNYEPKEINFDEVEKVWNNKIFVAISDIHIWKENTDDVIKRIEAVTQDIINRDETDITIFCLWDIVENLAIGWMHKWQVEKMDWPFSFDLIMKTVEVFEEMLIKIRESWKNVGLIWQIWNHDRISEKDHMEYTWWLVIYELIKRWLQNTDIYVDYLNNIWWTYLSDELCFILQHWHLWWVKKKTKDILWEYWDNKKYNIILQWHIHQAILEDSSKNATRIIVPALAGSWHYDKSLWLSSYPWYVVIKMNRFKLPDVQFIRLP